MSNDLTLSNIQVPAHLAARVGTGSALASSLGGGLASGDTSGYPRISIKGARFRIVEGDTETVLESTSLYAVIVGANPRLSKTFYKAAWSKDAEPTAPDCFSLDGISPDPSAEDPQNDLCATCPHNAWGSRTTPNGQQIKACADQKRLAIVAAEDPGGSIYLLQVTPAALKNLNQYQKELSVRGIPPEIVKTKITFDTDASFPKLQFSFGGFLDEETQGIVDNLFGTDRVKEITGEKVTSIKAEVVKPAIAAPVAPEPAVEVVEEESAPTPAADPEPATAQRGFGASKPEPKPEEPPQAKAKPAAKKPAQSAEADSLADEIAALVGGFDDE